MMTLRTELGPKSFHQVLSFGHNSDQVRNAQMLRSKYIKLISIFDRNSRLTRVHIQMIVVLQNVYGVEVRAG